MKKIKVKLTQVPDNKSIVSARKVYEVNLGNGHVNEFRSKRDAQEFINLTSKFLSYKMIECNKLLSDLFVLYRDAWPYFSRTATSNDNLRKDTICKNALTQIQNALDKVHAHSGQNSNHFMFHDFRLIIHEAKTVIDILQDQHKRRSNAHEQLQLEIVQQFRLKISYDIQNWHNGQKFYSQRQENVDFGTMKVV